MKKPISSKERRLLATIILSGLCANAYHPYPSTYHVRDAITLLDRLLTNLEAPHEA